MISMNKYKIVNIVITVCVTIVSSCGYAPSLPADFDPEGKIVYIEDLSGRSGLGMPNFGDIVILDPKSGEKFILTKDGFVNEYPTWNNDGTKVLFESKRTRGSRTYSLSDPSNIFFLNLKDYQITQVDKDWKNRINYLFSQVNNMHPSLNNGGNKIAFSTLSRSLNYDIYLYELQHDSLSIIIDNVNRLWLLKWSANDFYLCVESMWLHTLPQPKGEMAILIFDISNKDTVLLKWEEDWAYRLGYLIDNYLIYTGFSREKGKQFLFEYELVKKQEKIIYEFEGVTAKSLIYGGSDDVYFIGTIDNDTDYHREDIYLLDLKSKKLTQITTDGNHKDHLDIYLREIKQFD
jgi:Tol biopolymer transport system component